MGPSVIGRFSFEKNIIRLDKCSTESTEQVQLRRD